MMLVLFMYMLFASTFTLGKIALEYVEPIFFIGFRMLLGGTILLGYQYFFNKIHWKYTHRDMHLFVQIILFHIFIAYTFEFWALQYVSSAKACLAYNLSPFLTALVGYFLFSEHMNGRKWFGLLLGFLGFIPILTEKTSTEPHGLWIISAPELALFVSVLSAVYGWLVIKQLLQRGYSPIMINGIGMVGGGILALITSFPLEGVPVLKADNVYVFIACALALVLIANVIGYNLYAYLLRRYSATFLSFAGFSTPLFAALFGWLVRGEEVSWQFFISLAIIFFALYLFYQQELEHPQHL